MYKSYLVSFSFFFFPSIFSFRFVPCFPLPLLNSLLALCFFSFSDLDNPLKKKKKGGKKFNLVPPLLPPPSFFFLIR